MMPEEKKMDKTKLSINIANTGETLVVLGAALWITGWAPTPYIFAFGTLLFAIGRLLEPRPQDAGITLRRLFTMRFIGIIVLAISAALMFVYESLNGIEVGDYVVNSTPAAWLLPFFIFVVLEVYTTFRIAYELKKLK